MKNYSEMSNQRLVDEFYATWKTSGISRSNINQYARKHYPDLYDEIEKRTLKLNKYKIGRQHKGKMRDISIFERIYCLQNNLDDRPLCIECKKNHVSTFMPYRNEYAQYCSHECQCHSPIHVKRGFETKKKKKYGEGNLTNAKKAHETRMRKYGSHHPKDFVKKTKDTKKRKYGDENYVNAEKMISTVEKHKAKNPNYYYEREQKAKSTKMKNGHDPNWNNREKFKKTVSQFTNEKKNAIKEKRKQTCLDNYGHEYATQSDDVKAKTSNTCLKLYGVQCTLNTPKAYESMVEAIREKAWNHFMLREVDIMPMFTKQEFVECNNELREWRWKCKKCGHEFMHAWKNISGHCPRCFEHNYHGMQDEVKKFICSICPNDNIVSDDRKTFSNEIEIDILDTTKKIGIELNGLAWHNVDRCIHGEKRITKMYHCKKTDMCNEKKIRLVHIFEDEWLEHKKLCKSKLKKILAAHLAKNIDASRCNICLDVDANEKEKLLIKYSFDGVDGSSIAYALKLRGKIVAMMTFSRSRNKIHEWQVLNYIEVNNFVVIDGFKTLFESFCKNMRPKSICCYLSRDWNTKDDIGCMKYVQTCAPKMYWEKKQHRFKGTSVNEKNISAYIIDVDIGKSFVQNMNDNGYYRIYDSGTMLFEKFFYES